MPASTKELRRRMQAVGNLQKITRAREMVAPTRLPGISHLLDL